MEEREHTHAAGAYTEKLLKEVLAGLVMRASMVCICLCVCGGRGMTRAFDWGPSQGSGCSHRPAMVRSSCATGPASESLSLGPRSTTMFAQRVRPPKPSQDQQLMTMGLLYPLATHRWFASLELVVLRLQPSPVVGPGLHSSSIPCPGPMLMCLHSLNSRVSQSINRQNVE